MRIGAILTGFLFALVSLQAQTIPEEEEAPAAILDFQLGDQDVELFLKGYWNLGFRFGLGVGVDAAGWWEGWYPSDIKGGFEFYQTPDLEFRLLIDKRWLAQAVYTAASASNAFLLGYRGREDEVVDFVNIGTYSLTIRPSANTFILPNRQGTPALNMGLNFGNGWYQSLLQYEPRTEEVRYFTGKREATQVRIGPHEWIARRFFRLPGTSWPGLVFLAESGGVYRAVDAGEVVADSATGLVEIPKLRANAYLARWTGMVVGNDPITSQPLSSETVGSETWLVLCRGNEYAPLELKNRYPLPDGFSPKTADLEVFFSRRQTPINPPQGLSWAIDKDVLVVEGQAAFPGRDYPFFNLIPGLYEPGGQSLPAAHELELGVQALKKEEGFFLGTAVQPDSIRVLRNDVPTASFRFTPSSGLLEILDPVLPTDRFEVRFLRQGPESGPPRLFVWQTGRWELGTDLNIQTAVGLAWPVEQSAYTTREDQAPGYGLLRMLLQGPSEKLLWEWELEGRLTVPDATGERLWFESGREAQSLYLETSILRPGALPPQNAGWGPDNPGNIVALSDSNRGRLRYRNYFDRDIFGNLFWKPWGATGVVPQDYGEDGTTGPYLALADSTDPVRSVVLEYELDTTRRWVSAQVFVNQGGSVDWTHLRVLRFRHRLQASSPNLSAYLVVGSLGEDPDGSGQIRAAIQREGLSHLGWVDPVASYQMLFPVPDGRPTGTGWQGRTWYQAAVVDRALARLIPLPSSSWSEISINLSPDEARVLAQTNSLQIVLVSNSATVQSGVYQWSDISWEGTTTFANAVPPATQAPRIWQDAEALRIDATQGPFSARTVLSPLKLNHYRILKFRLRVTSGPNPTQLRLRAVDRDGRGLVWTVSLIPSANWREVEIDHEGQAAFVDGIPLGTISWDPSARDLTDLMLEYLDTSPLQASLGDIRATGVRPQPEASTRGLVRWQDSGLTLETEARANTQAEISWQGLWAQTLGPWSHHLRTRLNYAEGWRFGGAYRLGLNWPFLRLIDAFQDTGERRQGFGLTLPLLGGTDAEISLRWNPWSSRQTLELKSAGLLRELAPMLTPSLSLVWDQNTTEGLASDSLAETWLWSTENLYRWDTDLVQRRLLRFQPRLGWQLENLELWTLTTAELEQTPLGNTTLGRTYKLELGGRWKHSFNDVPWNLGWDLSRQLSRQTTDHGTPDVNHLLGFWAQHLQNDLTALIIPPGRELIAAPEEFWAQLSSPSNQAYTGRLRADLSRAPMIGRWDFLLPLSVSGAWETQQRLLAQVQPPTHQASAQIQWLSLNQFGRRSAQPVFDGYDQDEFSSILRWDWNSGPLQQSRSLHLLQHIGISWELFEGRIEHQWSWETSRSWSWRGAFQLRWDVPVDFPIHIPYLRTPRNFQERLILIFGADSVWSAVVTERLPIQKIKMTPEAEWKFHPNGSLLVKWINALEWQEVRALVGTQINVEMRLTF